MNIFQSLEHATGLPWVLWSSLFAGALLLLSGVMVRARLAATQGGLVPDPGFTLRNVFELLVEMLKGLAGVTSHEHREWIPIVENSQDMEALSGRIREALALHPEAHAVLIRRHGLYTWGRTLSEAERHIEILEFLLEAVGRTESGPWP